MKWNGKLNVDAGKKNDFLIQYIINLLNLVSIFGGEVHSWMSGRIQKMGSYLACTGTYRLAANQLSWLVKTHISQSAIQRIVELLLISPLISP